MVSTKRTVSPLEVVTLQTIAAEVHEPFCALEVTTKGISGDKFTLNPEDLAGFDINEGKVSALCGSCALRVSIYPTEEGGTDTNNLSCLNK